MASKATITVNGKDLTDKLGSKVALILQTESALTQYWREASQAIPAGFIALFNNESMKDAIVEVTSEASTTAPAMIKTWKFSTIANFVRVGKQAAELEATLNGDAPSVVVIGEKLEAGTGKTRATRKELSEAELMALVTA